MFRTSHRDRSVYLGFHAQKAGYYPFMVRHSLGFTVDYNAEKWSPVTTLVLKKVIHPIAMYAKWVKSGPPVFNQPVGYDLTAGDWVAPNGKGTNPDMIFTGQLDKKAEEDFDYKLRITFPGAGDGIQEFSVPALPSGEGSALRSPHDAPSGGYQSELLRDQSRHPGHAAKYDYNGNRNYFIRVRTVLDEKGVVKSALYGKIYGDFPKFRYYLNPTANSLSVECDPKQNLLQGLKSTEQVDAP